MLVKSGGSEQHSNKHKPAMLLPHGVTGSTNDSESFSPGSNPGEAALKLRLDKVT